MPVLVPLRRLATATLLAGLLMAAFLLLSGTRPPAPPADRRSHGAARQEGGPVLPGRVAFLDAAPREVADAPAREPVDVPGLGRILVGVRLVLVGSETLEPAPGERVTLTVESKDAHPVAVAQAVSDSNGKIVVEPFALPVMRRESLGTARIVVRGPGTGPLLQWAYRDLRLKRHEALDGPVDVDAVLVVWLEAIALVATAQSELVVRVRTDPGTHPVAGAAVVVAGTHLGWTDARGEWSGVLPPGLRARGEIAVHAQRVTPQGAIASAPTTLAPGVDRVDLLLPSSVWGRVADSHARPVPGVALYLCTEGARARPGWRQFPPARGIWQMSDVQATVSDEEGKFSFVGAEAGGRYDVVAHSDARELVALAEGVTTADSPLMLSLERTRVRIRLVDEASGSELTGSFQVLDARDAEGRTSSFWTELPGAALAGDYVAALPARLRVYCVADGYKPCVRALDLSPAAGSRFVDVAVPMEPGEIGTVTRFSCRSAETGEAMAARLQFFVGGAQIRDPLLRPTAPGEYAVYELPPVPMSCRAASRGAGTWALPASIDFEPQVADAPPHRIAIGDGGRLNLAFSERSARATDTDVHPQLRRLDDGTIQGVSWQPGGVFALQPLRGPFTSPNLEPGAYELTIRGSGVHDHVQHVMVAPRMETLVEVSLVAK